MRKLFAHPVHTLNAGVWLLFIVLICGVVAFPLPRPIGQLSDYGNVLNRHGRDEINSLIESTKARYGIDVYILASWEDPFHDLDRYAVEILNQWDIASGDTLLAVFMKTGQDWDVRVLAGTNLAAHHPHLAGYVQKSISDLVAHRRIREAMEAIFPALQRSLAGVVQVNSGAHSNVGRIALVILVICLFAGAALFAHNRICPRCGHILRVKRIPNIYGGEDVVYYCPHCHYTRTKRERARGPRR